MNPTKITDKIIVTGLLLHSLVLTLFGMYIYLFQGNDDCSISLKNYFRFGPSNDLCFFGASINTFTRWSILNILYVSATILSSLNNQLISPWLSNVLTDYHYEPLNSPTRPHIIVQFYHLNSIVENAITTLTSITQIDMLILSVLGNSVISFIITRLYLKLKEKKEEILLNNLNYENNIGNSISNYFANMA